METESGLRNPALIERKSMEIIQEELDRRGVIFQDETEKAIIKRVIHATADFDFAENIKFTPEAAKNGVEILRDGGGLLITDTRMALAGLNQARLRDFNIRFICLMSDPEVSAIAKAKNLTRAAVAVDCVIERYINKNNNKNLKIIFAFGNAPTGLLRLAEKIENGFRPDLIIAMPVGFVNVIESKNRIWDICAKNNINLIAAMGRKGGSGAAAAACNALIYRACEK